MRTQFARPVVLILAAMNRSAHHKAARKARDLESVTRNLEQLASLNLSAARSAIYLHKSRQSLRQHAKPTIARGHHATRESSSCAKACANRGQTAKYASTSCSSSSKSTPPSSTLGGPESGHWHVFSGNMRELIQKISKWNSVAIFARTEC